MFRCTFVGPHEIPDVHMAAPVLHDAYYLTPHPSPQTNETMPWIVCGFRPGFEPDEPWPEQVEYVLDAGASDLEYRGEQPIGGVAVFRYVDG